MPLASIVCPAEEDGAPAATEAIFPPRTTIDPRSITEAFGPMIRTFVIVTSCAKMDPIAAHARHAILSTACRFMLIQSPSVEENKIHDISVS